MLLVQVILNNIARMLSFYSIVEPEFLNPYYTRFSYSSIWITWLFS